MSMCWVGVISTLGFQSSEEIFHKNKCWGSKFQTRVVPELSSGKFRLTLTTDHIWKYRVASSTKVRLYHVCIVPIALFTSETLMLIHANNNKVDVFRPIVYSDWSAVCGGPITSPATRYFGILCIQHFSELSQFAGSHYLAMWSS